MSDLSIGVSALNAAELALQVIGQNIANAGTPGYHRQVAMLSEAVPEQFAGLEARDRRSGTADSPVA